MHKKEKKTAKRTSIRKQFAGIFIGLMAGTILLCWFLNSGFLQKYYISNKKAVLMRMYEELGEAVANGEIDTDEYQFSLQQQCSKYNLSLLVLNANSEVVADSGFYFFFVSFPSPYLFTFPFLFLSFSGFSEEQPASSLLF